RRRGRCRRGRLARHLGVQGFLGGGEHWFVAVLVPANNWAVATPVRGPARSAAAITSPSPVWPVSTSG
ncbi:MAG: hypothetical protein ACRDRL_13670, partial [Sciscionella sp.]